MVEPLTPGELARPAVRFRPGVRWWWAAPLAVEETLRELTAIGDAGFGEVEIAFSADVWASGDQRANLRAVLERAGELDLKVSLTMGAAWPLQTPNTGAGSGFAQQELQYGRVDVAGGTTFTGAPPAAFDDLNATHPSTLVAVTAARVVTRGPAAELLPVDQRPQWGTPVRIPEITTVLDDLTDLTPYVEQGRLTWTAPDGDWIVFGFWQRDSAQSVTSAFDRDAAVQAADYLEQHQVGPGNFDVLRNVGADFFEDSLELAADSLFWAPCFPKEFAARRGYDLVKYLPLMFQHGMSRYWVPTNAPIPDFDLPDGSGVRIRDDYYTLLTDLYIDHHLAPFQEWASTHGMRYRAQAAYGQNLEPIRSNRALARLGGRVEAESFNSGDRFPTNIDHYGWRYALDWQRCIVSGAHQGGSTRISTELGAQFDSSGQIGLGDYKAMLDKEWAAGITRPFLHGFQYMSIGEPWPGKYRFGDTSVDSFNDVNNPQWPVFTELTAYWARGTQVLEAGTPLTDIAIYRKGFLTTAARIPAEEGTQPSQLFETRLLERKGYTIQYVDPEALAEPEAIGAGVLFPNGPRYRALVVDERTIPDAAAAAIATAAEAGLAIVFVGGDGPDHIQGSRVRCCATQGGVAHALDDIGLAPRTAWSDALVLTQLREADRVRYLYLYNTGNDTITFSPALEGSGKVSELNLWDGSVSPVPQYDEHDGRVTIPMTLAPRDTRVIALDQRQEPPVHVVGDAPAIGKLVATPEGTIVWKTTVTAEERLTLSTGTSVAVTAELPQRVAYPGPHTWSLAVEAYTPNGHRTITIPDLPGLWDWRDLPQIAGESGIGAYSGKLTIPADWLGPGRGVQINLGTVDGTAEHFLNEQLIGIQVSNGPDWDLTPYARPGANQLTVVVRTTIRNAVTRYNKTSTRTSPYGLRGPLRIEPFAAVVVA